MESRSIVRCCMVHGGRGTLHDLQIGSICLIFLMFQIIYIRESKQWLIVSVCSPLSDVV